MNNLEKVISLLNEETALFEQYEAQTNLISLESEDADSNYITKRGELAIAIDNIKQQIDNLLSEISDDALSSAVHCKGNYSDYQGEYKNVYDAAKQIYACVSRITDKNSEIIEVMQIKREELRGKLASSQNTPKIKKYLGALGTASIGGIFTGNDKKA